MWPHPDKLSKCQYLQSLKTNEIIFLIANKLMQIFDNLREGKPLMEDVAHKEMSESEAEEPPKPLPASKSTFVIPRVTRRKPKKRKLRNVENSTTYKSNPIHHPMSDSSDPEPHKSNNRIKIVKKKAKSPKAQSPKNSDYDDDDYENDFDEENKQSQKDGSDEYADEDFGDEEKKEDKKVSKTQQDIKVDKVGEKKLEHDVSFSFLMFS